MQTVLTILAYFFNICRFKVKPQDLPAASIFMVMTLGLYALIGFAHELNRLPIHLAFLSSIVDTGLLSALTASLLYLIRHPARILQTLTALAGSNAILGIFALPIIAWLHYANETRSDTALPIILLLGLIFWGIAVGAHILRHALETSFYTGIGVSLLYSLFMTSILAQLFPSV